MTLYTTVNMADLGFAGRLAYVRWLWGAGKLPQLDSDFADFLGVTPAWYSKWKTRADAPPGRDEQNAIALAVQPMGISVKWIFDNESDAPKRELWSFWVEAPRVETGLPKRAKEPVRGGRTSGAHPAKRSGRG